MAKKEAKLITLNVTTKELEVLRKLVGRHQSRYNFLKEHFDVEDLGVKGTLPEIKSLSKKLKAKY